MRIWVTSNNQEWAAKALDMTLEEVQAAYAAARKGKYICTIDTRGCENCERCRTLSAKCTLSTLTRTQKANVRTAVIASVDTL